MQTKTVINRIISFLLSVFFMFTVSTYTVWAAEITLSGNTGADLQAAIEAAGNTPTTIYISESFSFNGATVLIPAGTNITLRSQGGTPCILTQASERHFMVYGTLTLEEIILDGSTNGTGATASGGGIDVNVQGIYHGKLIMNSGAIIQNCYTKSGGAGISANYGTFVMNDGAVIQNCTGDSGGGLLLISSPATIYNGTIKGCKATCGGGIYLTGSNSTFIMYDGIIGGDNPGDGNTAGYGGGIFAVGTNNKIYIGGDSTGPAAGGNPKINNNTAYSYGGGVSLGGNGRYTMYRGEINGNRNTEPGIYGVGGGGMHLRAGSVFSFSGGTINNNTTVKNGGGIFVNGGNLIIDGTGTVSGNTAIINGGGIYGNADYTGTRSTNTVSRGTISGNKSKYGAGVYLENSNFIMGAVNGSNDSVVINSNTAAYMGGGVDAHDGSTFTMNCGTISGNQSVSGNSLTYGGGVEVYNGSAFTMKDGLITGNSATDYSGGVEVYKNSTFTMNGGSVANNTAPQGGGVSVGYESAVFTMNGGNIGGNTAGFGGGGVYVYATGSMTAASGIITDNHSAYGGGIFTVDTGKVDIDNCSITNNTATSDGGGIYTVDRTYANLTTGNRTNFTGNGAATSFVPGGDLNTKYPNIQYGTVTAPFTHPLNNYDINTEFGSPFNCHITFDSQGGSGVSDQVKDFGEKVDKPVNPVKTGYTFLGWWIMDENGDWAYEWDFDTILDPDIHGTELVLHAKWDAQMVTVSGTVTGLPDNSGIMIYYSADGGTTIHNVITDGDGIYNISALYDSSLLITPSKQTGYSVTPENRNITVTAENLIDNNFTYALNGYTVTFDSNKGTWIDSQTVSHGEKVTRPADPIKKGSRFMGWYTDNGTFQNEWDFDNDTVMNDITLYAQWSEVSGPGPINTARPKGPFNPKTADKSSIAPWSLLLCTSFTAAGILLWVNRKKKKAE